MRIIAVISLLAFAACPAMGTTYYIDYSSGSDANSGTSTRSPWQRHPYMVGFSGSYSHSSGDQFIFKGGVTWPAACFPIQSSVGGSAGKFDYYGVSQSYYTSNAWSRPIFDAQYQAGALFWMHQTANYVWIDNLDLRGVSAANNFGQSSIAIEGCNNFVVSNCWIHKWTHASSVTTDGQYGGFFNTPIGQQAGLTNVILTHCDIGNPDGDGNSGTCVYYAGEIAFCKIHDCPEGSLHGGYSIHDTEFYNIVASYDPTQHPNTAYLDAWNGYYPVYQPCYFYNNYIHDAGASELIYPVNTVSAANGQPTWYIYNNVVICNDYETVEIDPYSSGTPMYLYIYNNTFDNDLGVQINVVSRSTQPNLVSYYNNLMIGGSAPALGGTASVQSGNNLIVTEAAANAAGYVAAQYYNTPSASAMTVGAGANYTSLGWPSLTSSTSRGNDQTPYARPATGAWDIGAYQFSSAGGGGSTGGTSNQPPTVSAITQNVADVDPNTAGLQVYQGTTVQYSSTATDTDGDTLSWQWSYTVNGGSPVVFQSGTGTVPTITFTYPTNSAGETYVWTLSATDVTVSAQSQLTVGVEALPVVPTGLSFSATSGVITGPFVVTNGYIYQPVQTLITNVGITNCGMATYTFAITNAGNYVVQCLVQATNEGMDSFYVNIDAVPTDPYMVWKILPVTVGFQQELVSWQGNGAYNAPQFAPEVFTLSAGTHQLIIVGREAYTELQSISILQMVSPPQNLQVLPTIVNSPVYPLSGQ